MANEKYSCEEVIKAIKGTAGIKSVIALRLGCHRHTVDNYIDRHPTVARAFEAERASIVDLAEGKFVEKVKDGFWPSIRLALLTLGKDRGYFEKQQLHMTREELDSAIKAELAKLAGRE